jgi:hypothetical protein
MLGEIVAALDSLREIDLLGSGQQREATDLLKEQLKRVGGRDGEVLVRVARVLGSRSPAVVAQLDPAAFELVEERLCLAVVERQRLDQVTELGELDAPGLLAPRNELRDPRLTGPLHGSHSFGLPRRSS